MRASNAGRAPWLWMLGIAVAFVALVIPAIVAGGGGTSQANDMMDYHAIEIRRIETQWPTPDLRDAFTTTTPGFHLVLAGLAKLGCSALALRVIAALAGLAAWLVAWRVAVVWCGAARATLLIAPMAVSPYVLGSAIWLTTDASALALGAATMGLALVGWRRSREAWATAVLGAGTVLVRQIMLWCIVPGVLRAWMDGGRLSTRARGVAKVALPAVTCVIAFVLLWGGSMPPRFQPFHQAVWNPGAITFSLAMAGACGIFLLPWIWGRLDRTARRGALVAAALGLAMAAAPRSDYRKVLPPDAQRVGTRTENTWGPTAPDVVKGAGEVGRWGGPLWDVAKVAPTVAGRSTLLVGLAALGGAVLAGLWSLADRAGRGRSALMLLAAMAGMVASQSLNAQTFERYFDPWVLLSIGWLAAMAMPRARERSLSVGLLLLTIAQLGMTLAVVLKPAFTGPTLGDW
jgi:hypothetical protein